MVWHGVKKRLPKALMFITLCCLFFTYGLVVGRLEVFPYRVLRNARTALTAVVEARMTAPAPARLPNFVPTAKGHSPAAGNELLLVSGGPGYLKNIWPSGCLAWLIDRQGSVQHFWKYDPDLWNDLQFVSRVPFVSGDLYPVGVHVFDDGGLLATFQGVNSFPFAIGLARFDVRSNLVWKKEILAHHWFSVADDGRIFVPALRLVDSPVPIARTNANITSETGKICSDLVLVLDSSGNVLDEIVMLDALFASGWEGLLARPGGSRSADIETADPLHLNDVRLVGAYGASVQPWLSPDDLLVSFALINTVGILDSKARRFKWISSGATIGQHSPRFFGRGLLVLDNLGGDARLGGTQLVSIDLECGRPTVVFPKPGVRTPGLCRTETSGHLDISRDGKRVLLTLANAASIWEINPQSGEVLWEYGDAPAEGAAGGLKIHTAKYVELPLFLRDRGKP